jgi:hypothetical protein
MRGFFNKLFGKPKDPVLEAAQKVVDKTAKVIGSANKALANSASSQSSFDRALSSAAGSLSSQQQADVEEMMAMAKDRADLEVKYGKKSQSSSYPNLQTTNQAKPTSNKAASFSQGSSASSSRFSSATNGGVADKAMETAFNAMNAVNKAVGKGGQSSQDFNKTLGNFKNAVANSNAAHSIISEGLDSDLSDKDRREVKNIVNAALDFAKLERNAPVNPAPSKAPLQNRDTNVAAANKPKIVTAQPTKSPTDVANDKLDPVVRAFNVAFNNLNTAVERGDAALMKRALDHFSNVNGPKNLQGAADVVSIDNLKGLPAIDKVTGTAARVFCKDLAAVAERFKELSEKGGGLKMDAATAKGLQGMKDQFQGAMDKYRTNLERAPEMAASMEKGSVENKWTQSVRSGANASGKGDSGR